MKIIKALIIVSIIFVTANGCEDFSAFTPEIHSVKVTSQEVNGDGATVAIQIDAKAENIAIWWGDAAADYQLYQELIAQPDTGKNYTSTYPQAETFNDNKSWDGITELEHTYQALGTYSLVIIASSNGNFSEENLQAKYEMELNVNP